MPRESYSGDALSLNIDGVQPSMEICTPSAMLIVWTWRGIMNLTICFNEAYYKASFMEEYLGLVKSILLKETRTA